jgi:hypothetical protein
MHFVPSFSSYTLSDYLDIVFFVYLLGSDILHNCLSLIDELSQEPRRLLITKVKLKGQTHVLRDVTQKS